MKQCNKCGANAPIEDVNANIGSTKHCVCGGVFEEKETKGGFGGALVVALFGTTALLVVLTLLTPIIGNVAWEILSNGSYLLVTYIIVLVIVWANKKYFKL